MLTTARGWCRISQNWPKRDNKKKNGKKNFWLVVFGQLKNMSKK